MQFGDRGKTLNQESPPVARPYCEGIRHLEAVMLKVSEAAERKYPVFKDGNCLTNKCMGWQKYAHEYEPSIDQGYCLVLDPRVLNESE